MPNWCESTITIKGSKEDLDKIEETELDFFKILPMPDELYEDMKSENCVICSEPMVGENNISCRKCKKCDIESNMGGRVMEGSKEPFWQLNDKEKEIYIGWVKKYGTGSWYEWSWKNWGTKWNRHLVGMQRKDETLMIDIDTAWGTPDGILSALSKQYPNVTLHVEYDIELGNGSGTFTIKDGEVIDESTLPQTESWLSIGGNRRGSMEDDT